MSTLITSFLKNSRCFRRHSWGLLTLGWQHLDPCAASQKFKHARCVLWDGCFINCVDIWWNWLPVDVPVIKNTPNWSHQVCCVLFVERGDNGLVWKREWTSQREGGKPPHYETKLKKRRRIHQTCIFSYKEILNEVGVGGCWRSDPGLSLLWSLVGILQGRKTLSLSRFSSRSMLIFTFESIFMN